jgi:hypothetical protein
LGAKLFDREEKKRENVRKMEKGDEKEERRK